MIIVYVINFDAKYHRINCSMYRSLVVQKDCASHPSLLNDIPIFLHFCNKKDCYILIEFAIWGW